jgi:NADPH-dependent curcumin reductase CurA
MIIRQAVLARHPGVTSRVQATCFAIRQLRPEPGENCSTSPEPLAAGQIKVDTLVLSVDPYMRCRLDPDHPQLGEYIQSIELGAVVDGGGVGRVTESNHAGFTPGQVVVVPFTGYPWQDKAVVLDPDDPALALQLCPDYLMERPSLLLGALGMPGMTSWFCMLHAGRPQKPDTVVVSGAAGACGSLAGQLAKVHSGARNVVGICGSEDKGRWLVEEMGFDAAINYKDDAFTFKLEKACPDGVDVYMDNVGGRVSDAVLGMVNEGARIPICGQISQYDSDLPYSHLVSPEGLSPELRDLVYTKRKCIRERFLVLDWQEQWDDALKELGGLILAGKIHAPEAITHEFDPGQAFVDMMAGGNRGKALVFC